MTQRVFRALDAAVKNQIITEYARGGRHRLSEVQVALLTRRINDLTST